jgi:hypothetical protein
MRKVRRPVFYQLLREPTLHFAIIAAGLFGISFVTQSLRRPVVEVDRGAVERRIQQLERARGSSLPIGERQLAEAAYIDEQILAREARVRGFDDDERIRGILSQKMLHLLSGDVPQPTDAELRAYYEENRARYGRGAAVTIEAVHVPAQLARRRQDAVLAPASIAVAAPGARTTLTAVTLGELTWSFGDATAQLVFAAPTGKWVGPHESADGERWFRVIERTAATDAPALETISEQVRFDWMGEKEEALLRARVTDLRKRYAVRFTTGN